MSERNPDSGRLKKFARDFMQAYLRDHGFCPICGWTLPPCEHVALMVEVKTGKYTTAQRANGDKRVSGETAAPDTLPV